MEWYSNMKPRTLVQKTLTFSSPSQIPRDLWTLPWAHEHFPSQLAELQTQFPGDISGAPGFLEKQPRTQGSQYAVGEYIDEWGCHFENRQSGVIGEVKSPLVSSWEDLPKVIPPEEFLTINHGRINEFCKNSDRFVTGGCCPRPFERLQFIRGSENLYIDLAEQPPELFQLLEKVHQFYMKELELWAKTDVDALTIMDDWGAQRSLLISPRQWRKILNLCIKSTSTWRTSTGSSSLCTPMAIPGRSFPT